MTEKILIVDDSEIIRLAVSYPLIHAGYEVLQAKNGKEGLQTLKSHSDVLMVISDINMPEMDGLEMLAAIRKDPGFKRVPVVMLTSSFNEPLKAEAVASGATGWLTKPIRSEEVIKTVARYKENVAWM